MKMIKVFALLLVAGTALTLLSSCGSGNSAAPQLNSAGRHPAGWVAAHPAAFGANAAQCYECHGSDLMGGISKVSCFSATFNGITCHASGPGNHPAGWSDPAMHGVHAKSAVSGANGFAACQVCHGTLFNGGIVNTSCYSCHGVSAPHPPKPWFGGAYTHTTTDPSNAAVCALCHTAGANLSPAFQLPSYASGTPGCFNSTLCHGASPHPADWLLTHNQAANIPGACQICHGAQLQGDPAFGSPACSSCHTALAPGAYPVLGECISCHGKPPATGQHDFHSTSSFGPQLGTNCDPCHHGFGSGTGDTLHGTRGFAAAVVFFNPAQPDVGAGPTATFDIPTHSCSNIACHIDNSTRVW